MSRSRDILAGPDRAPGWLEKVHADLHRHPELCVQEERSRRVVVATPAYLEKEG